MITPEMAINALTNHNLAQGESIITLHWKGTKIPRGHSINGHEIGWTQHGVVNDTKGNIIGTYQRTQEWGGPDKDEHTMLIVPSSIASTVPAFVKNMPDEVKKLMEKDES